MKQRFSSLEILLIVISFLLLTCCVGLIIVSWINLKPKDAVNPAGLTGQMVITEGAAFSEELRNSSSPQFKVLAFDVQNLGSVSVTFDLWFSQLIEVSRAEQQLRAGLQAVQNVGLVIDTNSIQITVKTPVTTAAPTTATHTPVTCPPQQAPCFDRETCVLVDRFCDGVNDCPDASDEDTARCATSCDGQFMLERPSGWFSSSRVSETYNSSSFCRWIIRAKPGLSVEVNFYQFETEENFDVVKLYEKVGPNKVLIGAFSGSTSPGNVWLLTDQSTLEFISNDINNLLGFNATYSAANTSNLTSEEKLTCTFEQGMCFWRQEQKLDDADWIRTSGSTFPPLSGPSADHTLGNSSGFYIVTPLSPNQEPKSFRIISLTLTPHTQPMCLSFWYHMFGEDVHRLQVLQVWPNITVIFQRDGNYGDNWNYGQVTLNLTTMTTVGFEALKNGGMRNDIALDDITLTSGPCGPTPPEPTTVSIPTTMPPTPTDCGGPFDLWEPNSTFSSPNYPKPYGNKAQCLWTLHAPEGCNIQLHFLDFDVESINDIVEVRDGEGLNSTLLAILTGSAVPTHDLFSTTTSMTVWFYTDSSIQGWGFKANFTSGVGLGSPAPCPADKFQCQMGSCIPGNSQCDSVVDCPDGSDEAECVFLQVNGSYRLQVKLSYSLFTVCANTWTSHLSDFTCGYLGYRSGEASLLPALPQDSPFATIRVASNGTLETSVSDTCINDTVISLSCNNHPCGTRLVINFTTETHQSNNRTAAQAGESRVVGGVDAVKGAWPWIVSLHWRGRHACGASLIGRDWLLTAAHCVYGKNLHLHFWTAILSLHTQSDVSSVDVQTRQVDRIIINRDYNRQTKQADIAMMHLAQPVNFTDSIQPICLSKDQNFTVGRRCFIAGWGREAEGGSLPNVLQEAQVPLVDQVQCQLQLPEYTITSSMLCAGFPEGGVDSCQGDSGGPLMCLDSGLWTQIGVTSFGIGCGRPQRPGVYARVSAFSSWIAQTRRS